jgi:hypothetical protein
MIKRRDTNSSGHGHMNTNKSIIAFITSDKIRSRIESILQLIHGQVIIELELSWLAVGSVDHFTNIILIQISTLLTENTSTSIGIESPTFLVLLRNLNTLIILSDSIDDWMGISNGTLRTSI